MTKIEDKQPIITDQSLKDMMAFLENAAKLVNDERVRTAYDKVVTSMHNGYENMADNEEKKAWLNYVLTDQCYRLGFYLWRHKIDGDHVDEMFDQLFSFMLPEDAIEIARTASMLDAQADAELSKKHIEIDKRRKGIEIFQSVLAGDDLETAKRKMEEYEARQAQVLENLEKQQEAPGKM